MSAISRDHDDVGFLIIQLSKNVSSSACIRFSFTNYQLTQLQLCNFGDFGNHANLTDIIFWLTLKPSPPKGNTCNPGIYPSIPNDGDDVQSPFRVSASVEFNTKSITAMKVYVDGAVAGVSSGPVFDQPITAARGTHIMVIQAWDTAGRLYRLTENVNVQ